MKLSLLELTQSILSSLGSDEVNSISDTAEARQVAQIVRDTYFNILARANLPEHHSLFQLVSSGDDTLPVLMTKPDNVCRVDWIKYNISEDSVDEFVDMRFLTVKDFIDYGQRLKNDDTDVETYTLDSQTFYLKNDQAPRYYTIYKDIYVLFDAFDEDVETTLQSSKSQAFGLVVPSFSTEDSFIPNIDEQQFTLLLNEAKSLAFLEIKQTTHEKAELESRRQWRSMQKNKKLHDLSDWEKLPYYGRK